MTMRAQPRLPRTMFHATQMSRMKSILRHGLLRDHCGEIHGEMTLRPPEKTIYLSRHRNSNNLNTNLFLDTKDDPVIVLEIDTREIRHENIYPDDALFVGFGQEDVFEDAEEISEALSISVEEAQSLLDRWEAMSDVDLVKDMKSLWPWYLAEHGEISVAQDISSRSILRVRDYETGKIIKDTRYMEMSLSL